MRRKERRRHAEPPRNGATGRRRAPVRQRARTKIARSAAARSRPLAEGLQGRSDGATRRTESAPIQQRTCSKIARSTAARSRPLAEGCFSRMLVASPSARLRTCKGGAIVRGNEPQPLPYSAAGPHEKRAQCGGPKAPPPVRQRTCMKSARSAAGRKRRSLFGIEPARKSRAVRRAEASRSGGPQFVQTCVRTAGFAPRTKIAL